jgi:hypothetical protein
MNWLKFLAIPLFFLVACATHKDATLPEFGKSYGPKKVRPEKAISVQEMMSIFDGQKEEMKFTFKAPIEEICLTAGCWISVDKGNGEKFMVQFKNHFTIPTDTKIGSEAYIRGVAYWDTVSVNMLKHFAEDAGKSQAEIDKITEAQYKMGFEADGIRLVK